MAGEAMQEARVAVDRARVLRREFAAAGDNPQLGRALEQLETAAGELCAGFESLEQRMDNLERGLRAVGGHPALA